MKVAKLFIIVAVVFVVASLAGAQDAAPESIVMVPHTDDLSGFETVVPDGWTNAVGGMFARQSSVADQTALILQTAPLAPDALLNAILPQLLLEEVPESTGTYQGAVLEWTLYQVDVTLGVTVRIDLALAQGDGQTYLVLLQTPPDDYEELHTSVFLPVLDAFAPLPEAPEEPVPYLVEEVTFDNGDVTLAGTLTLPPTDGPHPVVVLVSGSGPQNRDEALGAGIAIRPFRLLADALTRAGVAVLRYDDRGVGESTGTFADATIPDFSTDAEAAIDYLLSREEINPDQIGLIGHSEGGLVAAMLGARNEDLDFIIALAGPGANGRDVLRLQNQRIMETTEGVTPEQLEAELAFVDELFAVLDDPAALEALVYERALERLQALPEDQQAALGDLEQYAQVAAQQLAQQYSAAWFESFLNYDPMPDWAQTTIPVLAIFAGKDVQVDAEQNAPALEAALEEAGNENYEVVILPDANHLFQVADTGGLGEYGLLPAEFTPDLLPTILDWLETHVGIAG